MGSGYDVNSGQIQWFESAGDSSKKRRSTFAPTNLHRKIGGVLMENNEDQNQIIIIVVYLLDEESGEIALVINCYTI